MPNACRRGSQLLLAAVSFALLLGTARAGTMYYLFDGSGNRVAAIDPAHLSTRSAPPGAITAYLGRTPPDGYLLCDGHAVSRTQYRELFAVIGETYGKGNGSTTFNLPDLRGAFLRGLDVATVDRPSRAGIDPDTARTAVGSVQSHALQEFRLSNTARVAAAGATTTEFYSAQINLGYNASGYGTAADAVMYRLAPGPGYGALVPVNANVAAETRPRNVAVNYLIAY